MPTVAFSGTRDLDTRRGSRAHTALAREIDALPADTLVIHGGNGNVDWTVDVLAKQRGLATQPYVADWKKYHRPGKKNPAGMIRNRQMAEARPERWVIVWNGVSPGSGGARKLTEQYGIALTEYVIP